MQSNIYAKVAPLLKETPSKFDEKILESFLNLYHSGMYIYPSAMQRQLGINIVEVYRILELCVRVGMLEQVLEVYCPRCQRDEVVERPIQHAIVIYRVL